MDNYAQALARRDRLETARLILRTPGPPDIPAIVAIAGEREVAVRLGRVPHPYGEADARYFLDRIVPDELVWGIEDRSSGMLVGMIGLSPQTDGGAELGYYIAREQWNRGYATEAGRRVVELALDVLPRGRLRAGYFADNPASGRVLEKLGFKIAGQATRGCLALGETVSSIEMVYYGNGKAIRTGPGA